MIRAHSMARVSCSLPSTSSLHCADVGTLFLGQSMPVCQRRTYAPLYVRASTLSSAPSFISSADATLGESTRLDFPILNQEVNGHKLVYLDNAATSQKPVPVLDTLRDYYESYNSNVHRGIHALSAKATDEYEAARRKVAKCVNAPSCRDIVFTRNATEAINFLAYTWGWTHLKHGDEVVLSIAEHHSMIVPWQFVAKKTGAVLKYISLTKDEVADMDQLKDLLSKRTKLVALHHVSNVLGSINPVEQVVEWSKKYGTKVLLDACQSVPHMPVDVQDLGVDFLVASSHKMCGPTGAGFLYGKSELLQDLPPFLGGGEMIAEVFLDHSTYAEPPSRFEAGTPAIGEAIGFGAAVDYLTSIGLQRIHDYEADLSEYLYERLSAVPKVRIYGPALKVGGRAALCSFNVDGIHPTDIATFLDQQALQPLLLIKFRGQIKSNHHQSLLPADYGNIMSFCRGGSAYPVRCLMTPMQKEHDVE